jgi:hypothetical protein
MNGGNADYAGAIICQSFIFLISPSRKGLKK